MDMPKNGDTRKSQVLIVFNAETDKTELVPYKDFKSIDSAIDGLPCRFRRSTIDIPLVGKMDVDFWCNDDFRRLFKHGTKLNVKATMLYGSPIYGDVAVSVAIDDRTDTRGFEHQETFMDGEWEEDITEAWMAEDYLIRIFKGYEKENAALHKKLDIPDKQTKAVEK